MKLQIQLLFYHILLSIVSHNKGNELSLQCYSHHGLAEMMYNEQLSTLKTLRIQILVDLRVFNDRMLTNVFGISISCNY